MGSRRFISIGAVGSVVSLAALVAFAACAGSVPAGASCKASSECEPGLACLYGLGAGCDAPGQCAIPVNDCSGTSAGLVLCGCSGAKLDLSCLPSSASLPQRTATGLACQAQADAGGSDAGAGD